MTKKLLIDTTPSIKAVKIAAQSKIKKALIGGYLSFFKGKGAEFYGYENYEFTDDASLIDWKASMKTNKLLIKKYQEERNLKFFFLIDVSSSMIYTTGKKLKNEYAAEIIISLAYLMYIYGDFIGFGFFNDKIFQYSPPTKGKSSYYKLVKNLVNPNNYGGNCNLSNALNYIKNRLESKTVIIIVSDFIGLDNKWENLLSLISTKYKFVVIMTKDPADIKLPFVKDRVILEDPFSNKKKYVNQDMVEGYNKFAKKEQSRIEDLFIKNNIKFLTLYTNKSFLSPLVTFLTTKGGGFK